jgi:hypothetical protein
MKNLRMILLSSSVAFACAAARVNASVDWISDSTNGFSLSLSGTGADWGTDGLDVSPSGLWSFEGSGQVRLSGPVNTVLLNEWGTGVEFMPTASHDNSVPYADKFSVPGSFEDGNTFDPVLAKGTPFAGWEGSYTLRYEISSLQDPSTWDWQMYVSCSGPAMNVPGPKPDLVVAVPEPNSILLVGFGLLALPILHRRKH